MNKTFVVWISVIVIAIVLSGSSFAQNTPEGTEWVESHGYTGCVKLSNGTISVILEPNCGGRVLEYTLNGVNAIYINPSHDGWTYTLGERAIDPCGGRCDIGPETLVPRRENLWVGRWTAEIIGPRAARLTSIEDEGTGVQLIREFRLDANSSHLKFTQIIKNISTKTRQYNHWSRTFGTGGGICLVPLSESSRFPQGYIIYGPGSIMTFRHQRHENIRVRDGFLEISGTPPQPKFGIDSYAGWLGYITRDDLLFVKRFPVYPDRVYGELAAYTISIWYNKDQMCELEPIGPRETIKSGESASFTEDWWLLPYDYPKNGEQVNIGAFEKYVNDNTK